MGSSHSRPAATTPVAVDTSSTLPPRSLKRLKSAPHLLRPLRPLESASISRSSSPSYNSLSEKQIEREPSRKGRPCDCIAPHDYWQPPLPPSPTKTLVPISLPIVLLPSPTAGLLPTYASTQHSQSEVAYLRFLHDYPQYSSSWHVDALRHSEYSRLGQDETYVDYMGGALYPASLISVHAEFLQSTVLGNTHSESARSVLLSLAVTYHLTFYYYHLNLAQSYLERLLPERGRPYCLSSMHHQGQQLSLQPMLAPHSSLSERPFLLHHSPHISSLRMLTTRCMVFVNLQRQKVLQLFIFLPLHKVAYA